MQFDWAQTCIRYELCHTVSMYLYKRFETGAHIRQIKMAVSPLYLYQVQTA